MGLMNDKLMKMIKTAATPDLNTRKPKIIVPAGAIDTHAHLFGPIEKYPLSQDRRYDPLDAGIHQYLAMLRVIGVDRAVVVNASAYGTDNRVILDGIETAGPNFRGIALVEPGITKPEIQQLHQRGIRGVRASTLAHTATGLADMEALANKISEFRWVFLVHLQHINELPALLPIIARLPTPCIIDNFGRIRGSDGVHNECFRLLIKLLEKVENCWIKLASFYRLSDVGPPGYQDMESYTRAFVETCPDRIIWGTNWPHPNLPGKIPNDGEIFDILFGWVEDEKIRRKILVENPEKLFGFT